LFKSISSDWFARFLSVAVAYFSLPFVLHTLGQERYGTWLLINSITGYLGLLMLVSPMAAVRYFAQHLAEGDQRSLNKAIGTCAGLYLIMGVIVLLAGHGLSAFFDSTYDIPESWQSDARMAFGLAVLYVSVGLIGTLPESILTAHHEFVLRNLIVMGTVLLRLGLILGVLTLRPSIVLLALIQLICLTLDALVGWLFIRRRYSGIRISLAEIDWGIARRMLSFSFYVLMLTLGGRLVFESDSLVIGAFMDVSRIPFYSVANTLSLYLAQFVWGVATVAMPVAVTLKTQGKAPELTGFFLKWSKITMSLTIMVGLFFIVFGPSFIGWWIGPSFEGPSGIVLQILMVSNLVFLPARAVALPILMGLGKPALPTMGFLAAGVLNLGLSLLLVGPLGLPGVALGTAIPNVLFAVGLLFFACRELKTPFLGYMQYVVLRAFLGAVPVLALLLWFSLALEVEGIFRLAGAGLAMALLFGLIWIFFVYRNDPYLNLRNRMVHLLGRGQA
jgi:O-antigen/teichoic acid export membrane protein